MKIIKKMCVGAFFLIMGSCCLFASQKLFRPYQMLSSYINSDIYGTLVVERRSYSTSDDSNNDHYIGTESNNLLSELKTGINQEDELPIYRVFFRKSELLLKETKDILKNNRHKTSMPEEIYSHFDRNLAITTPMISQKHPSNIKKSDVNSLINLTPASLEYSNTLKTESHAFDSLIKRIISKVNNPEKISPDDLRSVIALYSAMIFCPKNSITKVLTGITDGGIVYKEMVDHVQSKGSDINSYRKIYAKLNDAFGEEPAQVINHAVQCLLKEKKNRYNLLNRKIKIGLQDYINIIKEGAHPLYPIEQYDVNILLRLYSNLTDVPRNSITKALNYSIYTACPIYTKVNKYIEQQGSNPKAYRTIYARVSKALNGKAMSYLHMIIDNTIHNDEHKKELSFLDEDNTSQPKENYSDEQIFKNSFMNHKDENSTSINSKTEYLDSTNILNIGDDKSFISEKEQKRLNQIYRLLPECHSNSITRILLNKTTPNKKSPVWQSILDAIEQIKREAAKEGDTTTIDLNYFRRLQLLVEKGMGKPSNNTDPNIFQTADGKYQISLKEQGRLNRIFVLLPQYHSNSITRILLGNTKPNEKVPVWRSILDVIEQIKEEVKKDGDKTEIDINYFRKLQWSSVRVTGKGGSR